MGRELDAVSGSARGMLQIPAESLCVSGLLFRICKTGSLGKMVSKTPSRHDTKQS